MAEKFSTYKSVSDKFAIAVPQGKDWKQFCTGGMLASWNLPYGKLSFADGLASAEYIPDGGAVYVPSKATFTVGAASATFANTYGLSFQRSDETTYVLSAIPSSGSTSVAIDYLEPPESEIGGSDVGIYVRLCYKGTSTMITWGVDDATMLIESGAGATALVGTHGMETDIEFMIPYADFPSGGTFSITGYLSL